MNNGQIILKNENFKFSIFDSVPKPSQNTACILYRKNQGSENILVITPQRPVLGSEIRSGRFDSKMTISTAPRNYSVKKQIADQTGSFQFIVTIKLSYQIKSIEYVFKNQCWNFDEDIEGVIFQLLGRCHKHYDIENEIELENDLREQIGQAYERKLRYLWLLGNDVSVDVDERAKKIINSNLDTMVGTVIAKNEGEKVSVEIEEKERTEQLKLEAERRLEKERGKIALEKARGLNALKEEMGDSYTAFLAYANGEISGVELDDRIRNNRNADMMNKLMALKQLVELDVISGQALENAALKLLGGVTTVHGIEQREEEDQEDTAREGIYVEDAEEY